MESKLEIKENAISCYRGLKIYDKNYILKPEQKIILRFSSQPGALSLGYWDNSGVSSAIRPWQSHENTINFKIFQIYALNSIFK